MRPSPANPGSLYAALLGSAWTGLSPPVRTIHGGPGVRASGRFRVTLARRVLAPKLRRLCGLPRSAADCAVVLEVTGTAGQERWLRTFDGRPLRTRQRASPRGLLLERFRGLELAFSLRPHQGGIEYLQETAAVCAGPLRLPLPRWLSPIIAAREWPDDGGRIRVEVHIRLPGFGELMVYDGWIQVEEVAP